MIRPERKLLDFIDANATADTARLRLRHHGDPAMLFAALQIDCRRHAARKLSETLRCREFLFPTALSAEQSTSDALARFHATLIEPGERVVDLTAGLGIDAFHLARRAAAVTAIDIDPNVAEALSYNAEVLGISNLTAICGDATDWLSATEERFDTIFIDPARRGERGERLFALAQCSPDVTAMLPAMRRAAKRLIVKASPMLDVSHTIAELPGVTDLYCLGTATECKELTAVVDLCSDAQQEPVIHAVTPGHPSMSFRRSEEGAAGAQYAAPEPGMTLHEPLPAVMKAAPFNLLCERYGLGKIGRDTHLYVGRELPDCPTRQYRIAAVYEFSKRGIAECRREFPQGNVAARGFIVGAEELARRLKLKPGGDVKVFGVTTAAGKRLLVAGDAVIGL